MFRRQRRAFPGLVLHQSAVRGYAPCSDDGPHVVISFSLGTDRKDSIRAWERAAPSFKPRIRTIQTLCARRLFVVATLNPFALWSDLPGTLGTLDAAGIAFETMLFFKEHMQGARTPTAFLNSLRANHPELLDRHWQNERIAEVQSVPGQNRVLVGKEGIASLAKPSSGVAMRKPEPPNQLI